MRSVTWPGHFTPWPGPEESSNPPSPSLPAAFHPANIPIVATDTAHRLRPTIDDVTADNRWPPVSAAALCRLDDALAERIRRADELRGIAISAALTVLVGSAAYGIALGVWRAPEQAVYSAVKLPLLLFAIVATTAGAGSMLAIVLRAKLSLRQTSVCILLGIAVTSAVLGALSPIVLLVQAVVPPPDPSIVGLPIEDPRVRPSLDVARAQVLLHVLVVACVSTASSGALAMCSMPCPPHCRSTAMCRSSRRARPRDVELRAWPCERTASCLPRNCAIDPRVNYPPLGSAQSPAKARMSPSSSWSRFTGARPGRVLTR